MKARFTAYLPHVLSTPILDSTFTNLLLSQISVPASRSCIHSRSILCCCAINAVSSVKQHGRVPIESFWKKVMEQGDAFFSSWDLERETNHLTFRYHTPVTWIMLSVARWYTTHMSIESMHWPLYIPRRLLSIMHVHCTFKEIKEHCITRGI